MKIKLIKETIVKHNLLLLFALFGFIEILYFITQNRNVDYTLIHTTLDDAIPFLPIFIIPYVIWYAYVPLAMLYIYFKDKKAFTKQILTTVSGMAVCIFIFFVYPTAIDFRPTAEGEGFLLWVCRLIFANDKSVNVLPSLHCFEAVIIHLTTFHSENMKNKLTVRITSAVLVVLICLSTVFVKQHSVLDLIFGVVLAVVMYFMIYKLYPEKSKQPKIEMATE